MNIPFELPDDLHPDTKSLVLRFAEALGKKLLEGQEKRVAAGRKADDWTGAD